MSDPGIEEPIQVKEIPVKAVVNSIFHRFKDVNMDPRPMIEDIVTFLSIICAYQYVSFSYEQGSKFERWTSVQLSNKRVEASLVLIFSVYLIVLKLTYKVTYSYETAAPKKVISDNWEQIQQTQQPQIPEQPSTPNHELPLPVDSYSLLIKQLINNSIYGLVFMSCTTAYTYINVFNKKSKLVNIEQVNYLMFWFVTGNIAYSVGKILGKITGIKTFHHFGFMVGFFVLLMEIGLAHGFNAFIFI